ncbi:hypothetical protein Z517_00221 [Fonsecaea pedrosoi CBS 271.37]|uniref:Uncharacterized protein n=1 Tax=Fonsecaea pedrosoi CBS 271.37 TaxID=1442368 RepID=A0A0D2GV15_9EURO|nr:uncharacterized protein Z517_00221 [Fonsecaea pedrosoi CBS 271.37]KIW84833.1 hypothetical protein Z517_00221 [Fonsecaea pedrosoi CBS 271.37]
MADPTQNPPPDDNTLPSLRRFASADDLADILHGQDPGDTSLPAGESGDGVGEGVIPPAIASLEEQLVRYLAEQQDLEGEDTTASASDGDGDGDSEYEWFSYQVYFAEEDQLLRAGGAGAGADAGGTTDVPAGGALNSHPPMLFGRAANPDDDDGNDGDDDDDDDDDDDSDNPYAGANQVVSDLSDESKDDNDEEDVDDENNPQITPWHPRLVVAPSNPFRQRRPRNRRQPAHVHDGGRAMLFFALYNLRHARDRSAREAVQRAVALKRERERQAEREQAERLEREVQLENRVLGIGEAGSIWSGMRLRRDERDGRPVVDDVGHGIGTGIGGFRGDSAIVNHGDSGDGGGVDDNAAAPAVVMKDTFDYRKLATAGARRERQLIEAREEGERGFEW